MERVNIGDQVWDSGDCWSGIEPVIVTEKNVDLINQFFDRLYFWTEEEADMRNRISHARYGEWQAAAFTDAWWL